MGRNVRRVNAIEQLRPTGNDEVGEELTVDNAVVAMQTSYSDLVSHIELNVKGNAVRYTLDGTDPASGGAGGILAVGVYTWIKRKAEAAKFIESVTDSDGVIRFEPMSE
ncbi:MAG: hypothetical protein ACYTEQ_03595 [Planctomycetota bacterium]|jgi:hypothetical protein